MTYSEKKFLYESIMNEVTKTVNRRLNESDFLSFLNEDDDNQKFTKFEQSWINAWQGFTKDYIDFKKHVFEAIED